MFRRIFVGLATAAALSGLASLGLLGPAPSTFAAGSAGSPDPTFGSGGLVTTAFPGATAAEIASAALQQPDGRLLVGGTAQAPGRTSPTLGALARYNANGSLDSTFGSGGEVLSRPASAISTLGLDAAGDIFVLPAHREFSPGGRLDPGVTPAAITASSHGGIGLGTDGANWP